MSMVFAPTGTNEPKPCVGTDVLVVVCGLPGSGNRLLKRLFLAAGAEAYVRHGNGGAKLYRKLFRLHPHRIVAVMPVRDWYSERSANSWAQREEQRDECVAVTCQVMAEDGIPLRMVGFESLFLYPERAKDLLLEWAGLPIVPWPDGDYPRDENLKHHAEVE